MVVPLRNEKRQFIEGEGKRHPNYGKHLSEETRKKIGVRQKLFLIQHPEARRLIVERMRAISPTKRKEINEKHSQTLKARGARPPSREGWHQSNESKAKISQSNKGKHKGWAPSFKGRHHTEETKRKISEAKKGRFLGTNNPLYGRPSPMKGKHLTEEHKRKISEANKGEICWRKGIPHTKETKKKMSFAAKGRHPSLETRKKISHALMERWKNAEYRNRIVTAIMKGWRIKPNKKEILLDSILESLFPNEWKYVGDGQLIISGKCPDFWNGNGKVLELFGDYFHKGENPQERIDFFQQHNFDCCVIWEHELKQPEALREKIINFVTQGDEKMQELLCNNEGEKTGNVT
jgi:hypothetical protein